MTERMMQWFEFGHLPEPLQAVSREFATIAAWVEHNLPANPERTACLRKLLEAKDCAVRARIHKDPAAG